MTEKNNELIGQILGAYIASTHATMDQISDAGWQEAIHWAKRYADLSDRVEAHNDSVRVDNILMARNYFRDDVERAIAHYNHMKSDYDGSDQ